MAPMNPAPTLEYIAYLLEIKVHELQELLALEHRVIKKDVIEKSRYADDYMNFQTAALKNLLEVCGNKKYVQLLRRIVHRDEPRHFYFFANELEAVDRILTFMDEYNSDRLSLDGLELYSIPFLIIRTRNLKVLDISKNNLKDIAIIRQLPNLEVLIADDNEIVDISHLEGNKKLHTLSLNRNRVRRSFEVLKNMPSIREVYVIANKIYDADVKTILSCPYIQKIQLQDNPMNAPANLLSDVEGLRNFFNIEIPWHAQAPESPDTPKPTIPNTKADIPKAKSDPPASPGEEDLPIISYATREIYLQSNPDKTLLDLEKISAIFYNLIDKSFNGGENFFGLFGRWGRGKTYFWNYILDKNLRTGKKYSSVEFHAWKYQDTPGIWAYLYNTLNEAYLNHNMPKGRVGKWWHKIRKLYILNKTRGKLSTIVVVGLLSGIAISALTWLYDYFNAKEVLMSLLNVGLPVWVITMVGYVAKTVKTDVRNVILSVSSKVNFNSQLGFQHEIQQELKWLLQAWLPDLKNVQEKDRPKVFLFIDDIDRCSEDKIVQIVDYIRVLLHDKEIQKRIIVLAAIDERILLHAIQKKYKAFIENKDNDATYKELCREYMDKLFLAGLKLGPLTNYEKRQIVDGFTAHNTAEPDVSIKPVTDGISTKKVGEVINKANTGNKEETTAQGEAKVVIPANDNGSSQTQPVTRVGSEPIPSTARKEFPFEKWEQEFIKEILALNTDSTPRSIRVYTYRYLLGKQLVEKALREGKAPWAQWFNNKGAKKCFALKLLYYGFKSGPEQLLIDHAAFIKDYNENSLVKENLYGHEISVNQELGSIMYQVLMMIVAY